MALEQPHAAIRRWRESFSRRSLFGALTAFPPLLALGKQGASGKKRGRRKSFCLDGVTHSTRSKRKAQRLRRRGAVPGRCGPCTPVCPATGCGADDGCGGVCGCPAGMVCAAGICQACTITCTGAPADCGSALRTAVSAGGSLYVCPGTYQATFPIGFDTQIYGAGSGDNPATSTILDGNRAATVIFDPGGHAVTLSGLRVINGRATTDGGGIYQPATGRLTITNCVIAGNSATNGGGIATQGTLTLRKSRISGNAATDRGAGLLMNPGAVVSSRIEDSLITGNTSDFREGGGLHVSSGDLVISRTEISNNTASDGGGVYYTSGFGETITIEAGSRIINNRANDPAATGGGLALVGLGGITVAAGVTVSGNTTPQCSAGVTGC